jgi:hypothetical protein
MGQRAALLVFSALVARAAAAARNWRRRLGGPVLEHGVVARRRTAQVGGWAARPKWRGGGAVENGGGAGD